MPSGVGTPARPAVRWGRTLARAVAVAGVVLALAAAHPAAAQEPSGEAGALRGQVVDAGTGAPLEGAAVVLEPLDGGALPARGARSSPFLSASRSVLTAADGRYRFQGLAPGRYRLRVSRVGYRAATVEVEMGRAAGPRVSVGLTVEPVALEPIGVRSEAPRPYGRVRSPQEDGGGGRVAAVRLRQRRYLSTDVRAVTHGEVVESVTLGETDLFRALQRLPGVATRDDYTASLWVRGAPWHLTRVYFDGLPLLNPLHAFGVFAGVNPDALGAAFLQPGVRPASVAGGAAAVLDLLSRPGDADDGVRGTANVSLASARVSADGGLPGGRGGWMLAARRSYLDWVSAGIGRILDEPEASVPYAFQDLTGRIDYPLGNGRRLEASGLWHQDRITGDIPDVLHGTRARWGNAAARVTYEAPVTGLVSRHTLGVSRYGVRIREVEPDPAVDTLYAAPQGPTLDTRVLHLVLAGEFAPTAGADSASAWTAGYRLVRESAGIRLSGGSLAASNTRVALWGEYRWRPLAPLTVEAGLGVDGGPAVKDAGRLRLAPRLSARLKLGADLALSAAAGRHYQYIQPLGPAGPAFHDAFPASAVWVTAEESVPPIRADIATLGAEYWVGDAVLATANAYVRRTDGALTLDPRPGAVEERMDMVIGQNHARGVELSLRKLAGRWTGAVGYSYGRSQREAARLRYPAPADRRHIVTATSMVRLGHSFRVGAAFTGASGAPFTRTYYRRRNCSGQNGCDTREWQGEPNARRAPPYASLDVLVDWSHAFDSWELGVYLQLRNALGHDNDVTYSGSSEYCPGPGSATGCPGGYVVRDHFEQGLPRLPLFGFRASF